MKLSEAIKHYEQCFGPENPSQGCYYENCPLLDIVKVTSGDIHDEEGQITWKIQGCSLLAMFEGWLKRKKPGTPCIS